MLRTVNVKMNLANILAKFAQIVGIRAEIATSSVASMTEILIAEKLWEYLQVLMLKHTEIFAKFILTFTVRSKN